MNRRQKLNIVIPMAGEGTPFQQAGYAFPKPLIDINGKSMIEIVAENLRPTAAHRFIFICRKDHHLKFSLEEIFERAVGKKFKAVQLTEPTQGAACSVLTAVDYINNDDELIIANSDQVVDVAIDDFIKFAREQKVDGAIMTFRSSHPKWSFVRLDKDNSIIEVAEKKVISDKATVGVYYFRRGRSFVDAAFNMIEKDIRFNNDFYVSLVFNELILNGAKIKHWEIDQSQMHSMATPEDFMKYMMYLMLKGIKK
jgi:NDP-sugar pyrophosphorylase family protein